MTFVIDTPADQGAQQQQTGNPAATNPQDQAGLQSQGGLTQEQLTEIVKRDEHAQRHISNIETENAGMRTQLQELQAQYADMQSKLGSQNDFQELLNGMNNNSNQQQQQQQPPQQVQSELPDFDKLVSDKIQGFMSSKQDQLNMDTAAKALSSMFGVKADEHVTKIAEQNGMTFEGASDLSKNNPTLFENLFIKPFSQGNSGVAPTTGSQSQGSQAEQTVNMEHWNKMRRENPSQFWSVPVQKEYHKWFHQSQNK